MPAADGVLTVAVNVTLAPIPTVLLELVSEAAAEKYGIPAFDIRCELGRRRMVGGQEDMIVDVALDMLKARAQNTTAGAQA